ncbi:MAG: MFS transporter [Puniceicoccales bacterium]|jgi:MFS family permease|nr:MFS transporter [Puniceicoccales bacterium]
MKSRTPVFWTANFAWLFVVQILAFFVAQMLLTTLPLLVDRLAGDNRSVGICSGAMVFAMLFSRPFGGLLLDRFGRRKILLCAQIGLGISLMAYFAATSIAALVAVRILHGLFWAIAATSVSTIVAGLLPANRLGEGMGIFTLSIGIAMGAAPAVGFAIVEHYSFNALFLTCIVLNFLGFFLTSRLRLPFVRDTTTATDRPASTLFLRSALPPCLLIFMVASASSSITSFLPLYARQLGSPSAVPFFTISALVLLISRPIAGRLVDRYSALFISIPALFLLLLAFFALAHAPFPGWLSVAAVLHGLSFGALLGSLQVMALVGVKSCHFGAATATFFLGFDVGNGLGPLFSGAIADFFGYRTMYLHMAIPLFFSIFLAIYLIRARHR